MARPFLMFLLVCLAQFVSGLTFAGDPIRKVMIIGIDGVRPDALQVAVTPHLDSLIASGSVSYTAQTGDITSSGPGWSSLLTGVWRNKHGVDDNSFSGSNFGQYPHFFTRVKQNCGNLQTASIVHWSPINSQIVSDPDVVISVGTDIAVAQEASDLLSMGNPDVLFLHFDQVDHAGHASGFSSTNPSYLSAIENVDGLVGDVLSVLSARPSFANEDWLFLVTTDHGGLGTSHGGNTPEQRTIFFIVSGASAAQGQTIAPAPEIVDVPPTVFSFLGIPQDPAWAWDGEAVGLSATPPASQLECILCASSMSAEVNQVSKQVTLNWTAGGPLLDVNSYELRRNGELIANLSPASSQYVDSPSPSGKWHQVYEYSLIAVGGSNAGDCSALETRAILSPGDVRLAEDFNGYASDMQLDAAGWQRVDENNPLENSTWTISNPGGLQNPPCFDGKASKGAFMSSNSDFGGSGSLENPTGSGMSHDLWTPSFDCSGLDQVAVHLDCVATLNENGKAVFEVEVSSDGGVNWQRYFQRVAPSRNLVEPRAATDNANGFFGRLSVDISATAAQQPNVMIRFRHFEPSWDWYIAIDNVIVDNLLMGTGGSTTLLPVTDFAAGIPVGWQISGLNAGLNSWNASDPCSRSIVNAGASFPYQGGRAQHRLGSDFVILDSDCNPDPIEDEILMTPEVDCSQASEVYLHYRSEVLADAQAIEEVLVSFDQGQSFEPALFSYSGGGQIHTEEPMYANRILSVPSAAGQPSIRFAFRYMSPGNRWWWAITDVSISAEIDTHFMRADCNDDGAFDLADAIALLGHLFAGNQAPCLSACDANDDGTVDISDAIYSLANLFSGGSPIAEPLMCGPDPSLDMLSCNAYSSCP